MKYEYFSPVFPFESCFIFLSWPKCCEMLLGKKSKQAWTVIFVACNYAVNKRNAMDVVKSWYEGLKLIFLYCWVAD